MPEPTAIVPDKGLRPGFNPGAATIPKGSLVVLDTAGPERYRIALSGAAPANGVFGVAFEDILGTDALGPDNPGPHYGNVQIEGKAIVIAGAAVGIGLRVVSAAAGEGIAAGTGITVGVSVTAAGAQGDLFEVELAGPGGGTVAA